MQKTVTASVSFDNTVATAARDSKTTIPSETTDVQGLSHHIGQNNELLLVKKRSTLRHD
jgi:hypothetical protein